MAQRLGCDERARIGAIADAGLSVQEVPDPLGLLVLAVAFGARSGPCLVAAPAARLCRVRQVVLLDAAQPVEHRAAGHSEAVAVAAHRRRWGRLDR